MKSKSENSIMNLKLNWIFKRKRLNKNKSNNKDEKIKPKKMTSLIKLPK